MSFTSTHKSDQGFMNDKGKAHGLLFVESQMVSQSSGCVMNSMHSVKQYVCCISHDGVAIYTHWQHNIKSLDQTALCDTGWAGSNCVSMPAHCRARGHRY